MYSSDGARIRRGREFPTCRKGAPNYDGFMTEGCHVEQDYASSLSFPPHKAPKSTRESWVNGTRDTRKVAPPYLKAAVERGGGLGQLIHTQQEGKGLHHRKQFLVIERDWTSKSIQNYGVRTSLD
jgi:hypothetical protein